MSEAGSKNSPSCPGLTRASTTSVAAEKEDVDGRDKPGHDGVRKMRIAHLAAAALAVILISTLALGAWVVSLGPLPLAQARQVSTTIVDRNGKLLRAYAMADGRWRLPVDARTAVDPGYLKLLLAYEDRRFYSHGGVDALALGRAAFQLVTRGHIVSGGSTITMQLARLMEPRRERSVYAKLRQMVRAIEIERQLTKDRNRRKPAGSIAIPTSRGTACSTAWSKTVACEKKMRCRRKRSWCRGCAGRCRSWHRIPPIRRWRP
jgi:penicillin-binding protein 1C